MNRPFSRQGNGITLIADGRQIQNNNYDVVLGVIITKSLCKLMSQWH